MSVNKYLPHVFVLPEDDDNRQLANGFHLQVAQVLQVAGGWNNVLKVFKEEHVTTMDRFPAGFMVLLIDFDRKQDRLNHAKAAIPDHLADRVFVLGAWSEPEYLKADLGAYETIGSTLAADCREETELAWRHVLLQHNTGELDRLRVHVRPILFPSV